MLTFAATCHAVDRLARGIWPGLGRQPGPIAVGLVLAAKAGNIGTNHLFEAMVLDRQIAFALGLAGPRAACRSSRNAGVRSCWRRSGSPPSFTPRRGCSSPWFSSEAWRLVRSAPLDRGLRRAMPLVWLVGLALAVVPGLAVNLAVGSATFGRFARE